MCAHKGQSKSAWQAAGEKFHACGQRLTWRENPKGTIARSYIMEYSLYKTLACKYRSTKREIIEKYRIGKDFGIKFTDKHGNERVRLLWKGSLARDPHPLGQEADVIHKPKSTLKKPSLGVRMKAGRCEWCGKATPRLVVHQVRAMKELDETQPWAAFMKKINRKTLVVCESCHTIIHGKDCE